MDEKLDPETQSVPDDETAAPHILIWLRETYEP